MVSTTSKDVMFLNTPYSWAWHDDLAKVAEVLCQDAGVSVLELSKLVVAYARGSRRFTSLMTEVQKTIQAKHQELCQAKETALVASAPINRVALLASRNAYVEWLKSFAEQRFRWCLDDGESLAAAELGRILTLAAKGVSVCVGDSRCHFLTPYKRRKLEDCILYHSIEFHLRWKHRTKHANDDCNVEFANVLKKKKLLKKGQQAKLKRLRQELQKDMQGAELEWLIP